MFDPRKQTVIRVCTGPGPITLVVIPACVEVVDGRVKVEDVVVI